MNTMRKVISLLLCALMIATVAPMAVFATEDAGNTEPAANFGYLWDFEDKEAGVKLSDADFANKVGDVTWGGENYPSSNWETMVDPEDENNIVLNPIYLRKHVPSGSTKTTTTNDFYTNAVQFKSNGFMDGNIIEFSYDIYMTARGSATNDIPLLRLYYLLNGASKNSTLVALNTSAEVAPGTATAETSMGKVQIGSSVSKTELFALKWYNVRMQFNAVTGELLCYIDDVLIGTTSISGWDPSTHTINYMIGLRGYNADHAITAYVDDIYLGFITRFTKSDFADITDFGFDGFPMATAVDKLTAWSVGTEGENSFMVHTGSTREPLTWSDSANWLDLGKFSYSFDYKSTTKSSGGVLSVNVDRAAGTNGQEFRIIHQNSNILTFGPTIDTNIGLNIAYITTGKEAKWHNIETVFTPYVAEDYVNMCYEFYIDGKLAAYTDVIEGVDEEGNATYSYNFYTKITGTWTAKTDIQPAKHVQYISEGDTNGNGVADEGENVTYKWKWVAGKCPWTDPNNSHRAPACMWDGYYKEYIDGEGVSGILESDGKIAEMTAIYMFHYNNNTFHVDNLELELLHETKHIENVELLGYQLGADQTSVRFIAGVDSLNFGQVGMDIEVFDPLSAKGWIAKVDNQMTNSVYMALTADDEQIVAKEAFGARFFAMLSVYDIDSSAVIRVHPYTTKSGERTYSDPVVYSVLYSEGKPVEVSVVSAYVRDYDDGVKKGGITDGYSKSTYEQLIHPDGDWGSGGEGGGRAVSAFEGTMKVVTPKQFVGGNSKGYVSYVDEETGEEVFVLDEDGNKISKYHTMSARWKLANVIPYDYSELIGKTLIISAKVKISEVKKLDRTNFNVVADNGETYNVPTAVVYEGGNANLSIGFGDDAQWNYLGTAQAGNYRTYALPVSDEWVEVYASIDVTAEFVAKMGTKADANGVQQPVPLRPTITIGNPDGWASELYIDDVTCVAIPTLVG